MMKRLQDKVIILTGATSGIGRSAALYLAAEGARLVLSGRRKSEGEETVAMVREQGGTADFVCCDIAKEAEVKAMVDFAMAKYQRLDGAVNNASVEGTVQEILDTSEADWNSVIGINITGTFYCIKHEAAAMKATGGSIVVVASINSKIGCAGFAPYVTSKHAVLGLVKCASAELAPHQIRVNSVCPGIIYTPMHERLKQDTGDAVYDEFYEHRTHMKRPGRPEEVAGPIVWLLSDEASYMTGTEVVMDGGTLAT